MIDEMGEIKKHLSQIVKIAEEIVRVINDADLRRDAFSSVLHFLLDTLGMPTSIKLKQKIAEVQEIPPLSKFVSMVNPKSHSERIVAVAYYMKMYEGVNEFNKRDLIEKFKEAALPLPRNISRDINIAVKRGWLTKRRQGNTYTYYINIEGIKFIKSRIGAEEET